MIRTGCNWKPAPTFSKRNSIRPSNSRPPAGRGTGYLRSVAGRCGRLFSARGRHRQRKRPRHGPRIPAPCRRVGPRRPGGAVQRSGGHGRSRPGDERRGDLEPLPALRARSALAGRRPPPPPGAGTEAEPAEDPSKPHGAAPGHAPGHARPGGRSAALAAVDEELSSSLLPTAAGFRVSLPVDRSRGSPCEEMPGRPQLASSPRRLA